MTTGVTLSSAYFMSPVGYCRARPRIAPPEGESWEDVLNRIFPPNTNELTKEDARVMLKYMGLKNAHLANLLFDSMDLNQDGWLTKDEVLEVTTLLTSGKDKDIATFLFRVVDANHNKYISRKEFADVMFALLETKFHLERSGLKTDVPAFFQNFKNEDWSSYAKYCSNRISSDIFNYADSNRDNKLSFKEFYRWYRRGGAQVETVNGIVDDLLADFDDIRQNEDF